MPLTFEFVRKVAESDDAPKVMRKYTEAAARNAFDTIYVERAAPAEDFDRLALATLEGLLADGYYPTSDAHARAFFSEIGVTY